MFPSLIYTLLTYFLTDLRRSWSHFLLFLLTNLMAKFVGSAMCYFVAASTSTFGKRSFFRGKTRLRENFRRGVGHGHLRLCDDDALQWISHRSAEHCRISSLDAMVQCLSVRLECLGDQRVQEFDFVSCTRDRDLLDSGRRDSLSSSYFLSRSLGSLEESLRPRPDYVDVFSSFLPPVTASEEIQINIRDRQNERNSIS